MLESNLLVLVIVVAVITLFIPSYVAHSNQHPNRSLIYLLNILFGGTGIAWFLLLLWASSPGTSEKVG